ncbi:FAD-dependent oxidoreductase [Nonomuraea sp. NPDC046570]|uniref:FAD-dependent oxidoreductase n=1 Tax=Nonomuraea sp. NPDC046570 TaxID=3155255 RepID=UPI0033FD3A32
MDDVVVIGAGQAGLSSAYFLRRFGLAPVVLDAAAGPGGAWRHRSPSLTMDKVHGIFDLPGVRRPPHGDGGLPASVVVPGYYGGYERETGLTVLRPVKVGSVTRDAAGLLVVSASGREWTARAVVNATGTWTRPYWPYYPGAASFTGRQLHYASYRGPAEFTGRRVVVVGGGNSAAHVLSEIAGVAAATLWVTRRPPVFRDDDFGEEARREAVAMVEERVRAGLAPRSVVSVTGLGIVWATGFRSALDHLAPLRLRAPGGGIPVDGTQVVAEPRLQVVGYGPSASTIGANRAGRAAAQAVRRLLGERAVA